MSRARCNDLHMVKLMPLPPHHLFLWQKNPEWFTLLCRPTQVVLRLLNRCSSSLYNVINKTVEDKWSHDICLWTMPKFFTKQTACRPLKGPKMSFFIPVDLDIQTHLSERPNMSSLWIWCKSVQQFAETFHTQTKSQTAKNRTLCSLLCAVISNYGESILITAEISTSGRSNLTQDRNAATIVFARWRQCDSHLMHGSSNLPNSVSQTASWLVQPFLHRSQHKVHTLFNGPPLFALKNPHLKHVFSPHESQTSSPMVQPFLQGSWLWQRDRLTDRPCYSVCNKQQAAPT